MCARNAVARTDPPAGREGLRGGAVALRLWSEAETDQTGDEATERRHELDPARNGLHTLRERRNTNVQGAGNATQDL